MIISIQFGRLHYFIPSSCVRLQRDLLLQLPYLDARQAYSHCLRSSSSIVTACKKLRPSNLDEFDIQLPDDCFEPLLLPLRTSSLVFCAEMAKVARTLQCQHESAQSHELRLPTSRRIRNPSWRPEVGCLAIMHGAPASHAVPHAEKNAE